MSNLLELLQLLHANESIEVERLNPKQSVFLRKLITRDVVITPKNYTTQTRDFPLKRLARKRIHKQWIVRRGKEPEEEKPTRWPIGGGIRKPGRESSSESHYKMTAIVSLHSKKKTSGSKVRHFYSRKRIQSVDFEGTIGPSNVDGSGWDRGDQFALRMYIDIASQEFVDQVLNGAYLGDLRQLTFTRTGIVRATGSTHHPFGQIDIPITAAMTAIAVVTTPANFQAQGMPADVVLFGPVEESKPIVLVGLPRFKMAIGQFQLTNCYLAIGTSFEGGIWDAYASVNGSLNLFGAPLAMSSDLPPDTGLLSFNLESTDTPVLTDLGALTAIAGDLPFIDAWGERGAAFLLKEIKKYRLEKLNLIFDCAPQSAGLVSCSFEILTNPIAITRRDLEIQLEELRFEWLMGNPGEPAISTSATGNASINAFPGVLWETTIEVFPELSVSCSAEPAQLPWDRLWAWLQNVPHSPFQIAQYDGCIFSFFHDRTELYISDEGQDAVRVI